ncbi:MAG: hypothetical protein U1E73_04840 [Planctomycetota bacterium]
MQAPSRLVLPFLLATAAAAQATWVVDIANGPGANFTQIQPAITAAAPGDRILVRSGSYDTFVLGKPLSILGIGTPLVSGYTAASPIPAVTGLPAGTQVSITNLRFPLSSANPIALSIANCQGAVVLDRVATLAPIQVVNSSDVRGRQCDFQAATRLTGSDAAFERCTFHGSWISPYVPGNLPGLAIANGTVIASRCVFRGGDYSTGHIFVAPAGPAIDLAAATLTIVDDGSGLAAGGNGSPASAITGSGTLILDPQFALQPTGGAAAIDPAVAVVSRATPSLAVDVGPPGGTVDGDLAGTPGHGWFLFVGTVAPRHGLAPVVGDIWVTPVLLLGSGVIGATGRVGVQVPLPNSPILGGYSFTWQGLTLDAAGAILTTNPSSYVHGL